MDVGPAFPLSSDWDKSHVDTGCRRSDAYSDGVWCPEHTCYRGADWTPTPELDPPPSADTDAGVRNAYNATRWFRTVIVPETVMCCKYAQWVTAWKAEFEHCSRLVYDIEIVPLDKWPLAASIPIVEHNIFDHGRPPILRQIIPISNSSGSSHLVQGTSVFQWGPSIVPTRSHSPSACLPTSTALRPRHSQTVSISKWGPSIIPAPLSQAGGENISGAEA